MADLTNSVLKLRKSIDKKVAVFIKKLLKEYKLSRDDFIEWLSASIVQTTDTDGKYHFNLNEMQQVLIFNLNKLNLKQRTMVEDNLREVYQEAFAETAKKVGIKITGKPIGHGFVNAAINTPIDGRRFSDRIWSNTNDLANRIYKDVLYMMQTGTSPTKIAKQIKDDYNVTAYQAKRLVNTESARVQATAALDCYKNSNVINEVMWCATLETNTCEICADLDGKKFTLDDVPFLPAHPNCRCCYVPIVEGYEPLKRVDNENKDDNPIDYVTYNQWANNS